MDEPSQSKPLLKVVDAAALEAQERRAAGGGAWWGLLWCEWFAHSRMILLFLAAWLVAVWVLPLFANPGWIVLVGLIYALVAGPAFGGGDVIEGCEEFSLALPATRSERYLSRLAVGCGALILFTAMSLLALGLDLPQALARLYLDTGLVKPLQINNPGMLYGLVFAFPFAVFAGSFSCAAVARSRGLVLAAWFWGCLASLLGLLAGVRYEELMWDQLNGCASCPILVLGGIGLLSAGYQAYCRKEVGHAPPPVQLPARWWLWLILFLLGLALASSILMALNRHFPHLLPL